MSECSQAEQCQNQFESVHRKLDRLDEAVRGNGKPGVMIRLDRLEQTAKQQSKLFWMSLSAIATAVGSVVVSWFGGNS